jgi:hypothetical protein
VRDALFADAELPKNRIEHSIRSYPASHAPDAARRLAQCLAA